MKAALVLIFLIVGFLGFSQTSFEKGLDLLSQTKYQKAAEAFLEEAQATPTSAVYYNLGIAYMGEQDSISALWAFEYALKLNPSNVKALHNAGMLFNAIHPEKEWTNPFGIGTRVIAYFSAKTWLILAVICSLGLSIFLFLVVLNKTFKYKGLNPFFAGLFFTLLIASIGAYNANKTHFSNASHAIVKDQNTQFFIGKEGVPANSIFYPGERLKFIESQDDWCALQDSNGDLFWVTNAAVLIY